MSRRPDTHPRTVTVLRFLADDPTQWRYGYDIARQTGISSGTLYPLLLRLAERGYLDTRWEHDPPRGRPRRHLYRLTATGAAHAAQVTAVTFAGRISARPGLEGA